MSNCLDCPPCEDLYTDSECSDKVRFKCLIYTEDAIEFIDILPNDTGDTIVKKLSDAIKIVNDKIIGASGSFESVDGKTITIVNGLITSII